MDNIISKLNEFKMFWDQPSPNIEGCDDIITDLKVQILDFSIFSGGSDLDLFAKEVAIARDILEHACLLSIKQNDSEGFERNVAQVKAFYFDYSSFADESERKYTILGLNLLSLLSQNRISEFHTELELIPHDKHDDIYIKFPIQLEQYLMEGRYNKVLGAREHAPVEEYLYFFENLVDTARDEIAECCEQAYEHLEFQDLQKLLFFSNSDDCKNFIEEKGWGVEGDKVTLVEEKTDNTEIPSMRLIHETLGYARELERIV